LAPWDGASALTACMDTFRLIDSQRVHFRDGVRVHGYVTRGGEAVNIIPEHASCEFSVRAFQGAELARVLEIVQRCARGAALASGVEVEVTVRRGYRDMKNNLALARRFGERLRGLGRSPRETDPEVGTGSTDMGDVSHAVPAIHPWLSICDENETTCHQHAFAACAGGPRGESTMLVAAKALALLTRDVLEDAALRGAAHSEFTSGA
jgi:metal-dependent amidase/aminoacylase/carboxypeptidase family protein